MKIESGKTYVDGYDRRVRIICTDRKCGVGVHLCVGLVDQEGSEGVYTYYHDGQYDADYDPKLDLVKEYKEPSYVWINVYGDDRIDDAYVSRKYADIAAQRNLESNGPSSVRIGLIKINLSTGIADNIKLES